MSRPAGPFETAYQVGTTLSASLDLDEVLASIARQVGEAMDVQWCDINEYDAGAGTMTYVAVWSEQLRREDTDYVGTVVSLAERPERDAVIQSRIENLTVIDRQQDQHDDGKDDEYRHLPAEHAPRRTLVADIDEIEKAGNNGLRFAAVDEGCAYPQFGQLIEQNNDQTQNEYQHEILLAAHGAAEGAVVGAAFFKFRLRTNGIAHIRQRLKALKIDRLAGQFTDPDGSLFDAAQCGVDFKNHFLFAAHHVEFHLTVKRIGALIRQRRVALIGFKIVA